MIAKSRWLAILVLSCSGDGSGPGVPAISGRWNYREIFRDELHLITCVDTGTYDIVQSGATFTGTYLQTGTCRTPSGPADNRARGTVEGGRIVGLTVRFLAPPCCEYEGLLMGSPPNGVAGRGVWTLQAAGVTYNFSGTWEANR